jgi:hypothetical protein
MDPRNNMPRYFSKRADHDPPWRCVPTGGGELTVPSPAVTMQRHPDRPVSTRHLQRRGVITLLTGR